MRRSTVSLVYDIILAFGDLQKHSMREKAQDLQVDKDAVTRHMSELETRGLAEIEGGKYGGARLYKSLLTRLGIVGLNNNELQDIVDGLRLLEKARGESKQELINRIA